jgi:putative hydrolase of the HAD superfamily
MILHPDTIFVFDLDDTLYSELSFEQSGIAYVYNKVKSCFFEHNFSFTIKDLKSKTWIDQLLEYKEISRLYPKEILLHYYRSHLPEIYLYPDARNFLNRIKANGNKMALVTDGRSLTQRNKLIALGVENFFDVVIISEEVGSEKPAVTNFQKVLDHCQGKQYIYFGDNPKKDFLGPNQLGWETIGLLDRGFNVHKQSSVFPKEYQPTRWIKNFDEF